MENKKRRKRIAWMCLPATLLFFLYLLPFIIPVHVKHSIFSDFSYTVYGGHVELDKYNGRQKIVRMPDYLWGRPVTAVGSRCFLKYSVISVGKVVIREIYLPRYLERIERGAFEYLEDLEAVHGGKAVSFIGNGAFGACHSLRTVEFGKNLKVIERRAFSNCSNLDFLAFPREMEFIGQCAFRGSGIRELPEEMHVAYIGGLAFGKTPWMEKQEDEFVVYDGVLLQYNGTDEIVRIPEGIRGVAGAFCTLYIDKDQGELPEIKEVYIPEGVEYIDDLAFSGRGNMRIYIPASVENIGYEMLRYITNADTFTIVTTSGSAAETHAREVGISCEIVEGW